MHTPQYALMTLGGAIPDYWVSDHWFIPDDMRRLKLVPVLLTNGTTPAIGRLASGVNVMPVAPCYTRAGRGHPADDPARGYTKGGLSILPYCLRVINAIELTEFLRDPDQFVQHNGVIPM